MAKTPRCLFICKKRVDSYGISYGLLNSATFVANALEDIGIDAKVVSVADYNQIDKEVTSYDPTHIFIEALWVIPDKLRELCQIHPRRKWIVRIHSKIPFISVEGMAIAWLRGYANVIREFNLKNLIVSGNSTEFNDDAKAVLHLNAVYLPNIYQPVQAPVMPGWSPPDYDNSLDRCIDIDVGCFGAIRPLKNQLLQGFAAIAFCNDIKKRCRFHINSNRIEDKNDATLKNLRALFENSEHTLIEHPWCPHIEFISIIKMMDIGMQVSYSESFNIVAADFAANGIPIVVSPDITWMPSKYMADPNSMEDIVKKLGRAWKDKDDTSPIRSLAKHNKEATKEWTRFLGVKY